MPASRRLLPLAVVLAALVAGCGLPRATASARVAYLDIDGDVAVSDRSGAAGASSSASDLGLDEEVVFMPRVDVDWGSFHASVNGFTVDYSGDGEATARISFGDSTIEQGTDVETDASFDYLVGTFVVDILPLPEVEFGIGLGVGFLSYDLAFAAKDVRAEVSVDDTVPFGYLAARLATQIGPVRLRGTVGGISVEFDDDDVNFLEFDVSGSLRVFGDDDLLEGYVTLGYRYLDLDYTWKPSDGRLDADVTLLGPYIGLEISF